jgi:sugar lactone lactonase YvrE
MAVGCALIAGAAWADDASRFLRPAAFTTLATTPFAIEGLTGDSAGNLYTTGRQPDLTRKCPIWRFGPDGTRATVAFIPNTAPGCNPSGIAFDRGGDLYVADGAAGIVFRVTPDAAGCSSDDSALCPTSFPVASNFVTGVPGTNGLAFDRDGNLWTGDGTTGQGRVWRIGPAGGECEPDFTGCVEVFRIQAMANVLDTAQSGGIANVGRDARTLPPGTINAQRQATNTAGSQPLVANGVAFNREGDLFVADTARGALWKVEFDRHGDVKTRMGCDATFSANTLCLDGVFVAHPYLEGTDGIALDRAGNIWNSANERNAIVVVTRHGRVMELFRSPATAAGLRNAGPLEFPTSPVLAGDKFCTANSDGNRRDNSPNTAGEIGGTSVPRGKISCMDQALRVPGMSLPAR